MRPADSPSGQGSDLVGVAERTGAGVEDAAIVKYSVAPPCCATTAAAMASMQAEAPATPVAGEDFAPWRQAS